MLDEAQNGVQMGTQSDTLEIEHHSLVSVLKRDRTAWFGFGVDKVKATRKLGKAQVHQEFLVI